MSRRDKLCLIGIVLLFAIGAPWAFGLFDPERYRSRSEGDQLSTKGDIPSSDAENNADIDPAWPTILGGTKPEPGFAALKFRIVDAISKTPIRAYLTVEYFTGSNYQTVFKSLPCNAKGELFANSVDAECWHRAQIECEGYVPRSLAPRRTIAGAVTDFGQIELEPLFEVTLKPKWPNGKPFECSAWVKRIWPLPTLDYPLPEPLATIENSEYRFKLTRGKWMAFLNSTYEMSAEIEFEVQPGKLVHEITVPARPPIGKGGIDIVVLNANGEPERAPYLLLTPIGFPFKFRGTGFEFPMTDPPYQFRRLPAGRYTLRASASRKVPNRDMNTWIFEREVQVEVKDLDAITEVKLVMPRALDVSVHVTARGQPVNGAHLFLGGTPSLVSGYASFNTDSKGMATIPEVCPGIGRVFQWSWTSLTDDGRGFVAYYPGLREDGWREFDGMKVDVSGEEALTKEIELYPADRAVLHSRVRVDGMVPQDRVELCDLAGKKLADFGVDEEGEFTLLAVPLGNYVLRLRRAYSQNSPADGASVEVVVNLPTAGEHELKLELRTYAVAGKITCPPEIESIDESGSVTVELKDSVRPGRSRSAILDKKTGGFAFAGIQQGDYEIFLLLTPRDGLGSLSASMHVRIVDDDVTGLLLPMPELRRRVPITSVKVVPQFPDAHLGPLFTSINAEIWLENGQLFGIEQAGWSSESPTPFVVRLPADTECSIILRGSYIVEQRIEHVFKKSTEGSLSIAITFQRLTSRAFIELDRSAMRVEELALVTYTEDEDIEYMLGDRVMIDLGGKVGFMLSPKAPGTYTYKVKCKGFKTQELNVVFESGKVVTTKVTLQRE